MQEINKEEFGRLVAQRRKELGLTQRELAEKLFLSDKAVSKWERGLSLPDVALLSPLAEVLGVTLSELLLGHRREGELTGQEMEQLLAGAVELSAEEKGRRDAGKRRWKRAYGIGAVLGLLQMSILCWGARIPATEMTGNVLLVEGLCLLFGGWLCFFAKETLPVYYDQNPISFYGDGVFRINLAGLRLNNSNWPHILNAMRGWLVGAMVLFPGVWWVVHGWLPGGGEMALLLGFVLGMFLPVYVVGKRNE